MESAALLINMNLFIHAFVVVPVYCNKSKSSVLKTGFDLTEITHVE